MNKEILRFLPIEYTDQEFIIKEPYKESILDYLHRQGIKNRFVKDNAIAFRNDIRKKDFYTIVKIIRRQRDQTVQKGIIKYYL
jgi:hypothetical protein